MFLVAFAMALLQACHPADPDSSLNTAMTAPVSTFCTGRFLIDLPEGAKIIGSARNKYDFAQIEKPRVMSREQFLKELDEREAKLKASKHDVDPSQLLKVLRVEENTRVLAFWETPTAAGLINLEGHKWMEGNEFLIEDEAGASPPKTGTISRRDLGIARVAQSLAGLRPRPDTEIPTDPGYCFPGGFIASAEWENEEALTEFSLPGHPDAYVSVWFYPLAASKRDEPLLDRMGGVVNSLGNLASHVHVLRKGERTVAGYPGQEYLFTAPNGGGTPAHNFVWETQGEGTLEDPVVIIQMETGTQDGKGNPQKSSLSNEEALALWDRIVSTFRVRPTGPSKKTSDAGPLAPVSPMHAVTGEPCPATGEWECTDHGSVQRRHIRIGQAMPQAIFPAPRSAWQKVRGEHPAYALTVVWTLVRPDSVPGDGGGSGAT